MIDFNGALTLMASDKTVSQKLNRCDKSTKSTTLPLTGSLFTSLSPVEKAQGSLSETWLRMLVRAQVCDWDMTIPKFWHQRPCEKMGPAKNAGKISNPAAPGATYTVASLIVLPCRP